jgi:3-oxoacyl-[acyl-carrier protein] reductase
LALAESVADVAVNFRFREDAALEVCAPIKALGRRALPGQADVSLAAEVRQRVAAVRQGQGLVDILVNNAGIVA